MERLRAPGQNPYRFQTRSGPADATDLSLIPNDPLGAPEGVMARGMSRRTALKLFFLSAGAAACTRLPDALTPPPPDIKPTKPATQVPIETKIAPTQAEAGPFNSATATPEAPAQGAVEMTPEQIQKNIEDFLAGRTKINENIYDKKNRDLFRYTNVDLRILPLGYFELENSADTLQATGGIWEGGGDAQVVLLGFGIQDNMRILYLGFKNQTTGERIVVPFTTGLIKLTEGFMPKTGDAIIGDNQVVLEVSKTDPPLYRPLGVQLNTLYPYNSDLGKEILPAVGKPIMVQFVGPPAFSSREEFVTKFQAEVQSVTMVEAGWFFDHTQTEQSLILWLQGKGLKPAYAIVKSNLGQPIPDTSKLPLTLQFRIPAPPAK